jgi:hypothetical protein
LVLELFQEKKYRLKELVKPVYFALMYYMREDEYPKEFKRMGDELRETVDEIIEKIEDIRAA